MRYPFMCPEHNEVVVECSMKDIKTVMPCPICGKDCTRIFEPPMFEFKGGDWASKKPKKIADPKGTDWETRRQKERWE